MTMQEWEMVFIKIIIGLILILFAIDIYLFIKVRYILKNFRSIQKENEGYKDLQKKETSNSFYDY